MSIVPPMGVIAPSQRGAPSAIAYSVVLKITAPIDQKTAVQRPGIAPTATAWINKYIVAAFHQAMASGIEFN